MKYLVILTLIGFIAIASANTAYGLWVPQSPEELFAQSETVFVGTVTAINELEFERSNTFHVEEDGVTRIEVENYTQTLDEYTVTVEKFLKNPQASSTITMLEATVGGVPGRSSSIGGFEIGDRVLFYLPKIDGTNQYSPESFEIPKQCDAASVLEQPRIDGFNDFKMTQDGIKKNDNFVAGKPIKFVYNKDMGTLDGKRFDVNTRISKIAGNDWETVIHKNIHTESKPCEWISTASWEFVPTGGRYYMWVKTSEGDSTGGQSWSREVVVREFDFPLKQFKAGVPADEIQCNDGLALIQKYDGTPVCVTPETKEKLVEREWASKKYWTVSHSKANPTVMILPGAVIAENESLDPQVITVVLGKNNTVTWINGDDTAHTFVSDKGGDEWWSTGMMKPGESSSVTFNRTGVFEYHGTPGPWITGKVIVLEK